MKKIPLLFLFLLLLIFKASAQETIISEINYATLDKYIQLAKTNYPRKKIFDANVQKAQSNVSIAALSYFDMVTASYIYRPDQAVAVNQLNPYSVNGFQLGINFNLSTYLEKPAIAKKARMDLNIAKLEDDEYTTQLENEVKKRYYTYIKLLSDLKIKTEISQDSKSLADNLRDKYEKGTILIDAYSSAKQTEASSNSSKIQAEVDLLVAKDALEEIIGAKLTDIK